MTNNPKMLSVAQAAEKLDLSDRRVRQFIEAKRLKAVNIGGVWLIQRAELAKFQRRQRKPGRPGHMS